MRNTGSLEVHSLLFAHSLGKHLLNHYHEPFTKLIAGRGAVWPVTSLPVGSHSDVAVREDVSDHFIDMGSQPSPFLLPSSLCLLLILCSTHYRVFTANFLLNTFLPQLEWRTETLFCLLLFFLKTWTVLASIFY